MQNLERQLKTSTYAALQAAGFWFNLFYMLPLKINNRIAIQVLLGVCPC